MLFSKFILFEISLALGVVLSFSLILFIFTETSSKVEAQLETIKSREVLIELENGTLSTRKGELVVPASGKGPYPAVLLIPGSEMRTIGMSIYPQRFRGEWRIKAVLANCGITSLNGVL